MVPMRAATPLSIVKPNRSRGIFLLQTFAQRRIAESTTTRNNRFTFSNAFDL